MTREPPYIDGIALIFKVPCLHDQSMLKSAVKCDHQVSYIIAL